MASSSPGLPIDFPSVETRVDQSTDIWARDLKALVEHAKDRFGDVSWEAEGLPESEQVWGHKAVVYARAPKAFKERYFLSKPYARSPSSLRSPSPNALGPFFSSRSSTPPSSFRPSPIPGRSSSLSVDTFTSGGTMRGNGDGILRLTHGDTPELFQAQLEWLYTGEGFGDVVEWISAEDASGIGGSIRDSLGRRGNLADRRDKLGQDLTYMWRSKLYADVRIHLQPQDAAESASEDSDDSTDSLSSTAIFTAHRSILASRSPYFASVLLNASSFHPSTADIHLPTPPFTPAALHFCLGYMYAGHLDFSARSFDLLTAFQIHRAAAYLQLDPLIREIEARMVHDFCHGLDWGKCHCRRCAPRAARVWRFAIASDVGAVPLEKRAREYVVRGWGDSWGKDIGLAERGDRQSLVRSVENSITWANVISTFRAIAVVKATMEAGSRAKGRAASTWVDPLEGMVDSIETHTRNTLIENFPKIAEGREIWNLLSGKGFSDDLLEAVIREMVDGVGTANGCHEAPRIYQALVSSILLKVDFDTLQTVLKPRSRTRQQVEIAREGILSHIRRRWMQIREAGGFDGLEIWSVKEIADEIEIPVGDLLATATTSSLRPRIAAQARQTLRTGLPRTSRVASLSDAASLRTNNTGASRMSSVAGPSAPRPRPSSPSGASGLRRLRLSSAASTSSVTSARSIPPPRRLQPTSMSGPSARSPTAAKQGARVSIGGSGVRQPTARIGATSPSPSSRRVVKSLTTIRDGTRPSPSTPTATPKATRSRSPSKPPSVTSVRTNRTTRSAAPNTPSAPSLAPPIRPSPSKLSPIKPGLRPPVPSEQGGTRLRTASASTTTSVISRVASITSQVPSLPNRAPGATRTSLAPPVSEAETARVRTTSASTTVSARIRELSMASKASSVAPARMPIKPSLVVKSARPYPMQTAGAALKPLSSATAARVRNVSTASTASVRSRQPPSAMPSHLLVATQSTRSPSSSTTDDALEARTPQTSEISDPRIRCDGSDESEVFSAPATSKAPPVTTGRAARKVSTSSTRSTHSHFRSHPASAFDPPHRSTSPKPIPVLAITDGSQSFTGDGVALHIGIPCIVSLAKKRARFRAHVRYIGHLNGSRGPWVGIELENLDRSDVPTLPSGSKEGTHYFHLSSSSSNSTSDHPLQDAKYARQRRVEGIRDNIKKSRVNGSTPPTSAFGTGGLKPGNTHGSGSRGIGNKGSAEGGRGGLTGSGRAASGINGARAGPGTGDGGGKGSKRSASPFVGDWGGFEIPRAMFVRPSEVVFILGAE